MSKSFFGCFHDKLLCMCKYGSQFAMNFLSFAPKRRGKKEEAENQGKPTFIQKHAWAQMGYLVTFHGFQRNGKVKILQTACSGNKAYHLWQNKIK